MTTITIADPLVDLLDWCRTHPDLTPLLGARTYWKFTASIDTYPAMRIYDSVLPVILPSGGGLPITDAHIAFDIFGGAPADFLAVKQIATTLVAILHTFPQNYIIGNTMVKNAEVTGGINSPDPATGNPRYVLDSRWTCTPINS